MKDSVEKTFEYLPLTLAIETLGGISTPLVLRGTPLPATRTQVFSTAADNQPSVEIHIIMGESPVAERNLSITRFTLSDIPTMARGKPQIQVTFAIDEKCKITATALEKSLNNEIEVTTKDTQPYLTDKKIEELLKDAESTRSEDERKIQSIEVRNRADISIQKAELFLQKNQKDGILRSQYEKIEQALAEVGLAKNNDGIEALRTKVENLEKIMSQSSIDLGGFEDLFSGFNTVFNTSTRKKPKSSNTEQRKSKTKSDELEARDVKANEIGRIFGGGEFTLDSNLCFVLMPFEDDLKAVYDDHIRTIVEAKGLGCIRADEIVGTRQITRDIWERINRARFIIADLTKKNPNVFYELGIAHTLGKEVVLITQTMDDVPFDLKALRCIVYTFTPRGMKEMERKLERTIDEIMRSS